ncbi:MAG: VPLPA-CTERM-specific exosortase XrtD [Desulfocapsaceae bacterium]|nr:VPLPA-CTERM-specific exosortase XrtD [Desulfocapsaceae bacterium]
MISFQAATKKWEQNTIPFLALILSILALIIFREAASAMVDAWRQEEYSHGYLVPFIALLLLCNKMNDEKITSQSSWFGFGIVATCVLVQFLFQIADVKGLQPQVFLLALIGLFILFYGLKASRAVAGPLMFVVFAAPLPKFFYYAMSLNMQMMSTSLGTALLRLLGVSVLQDGNIIDLGSYQLQVVEACSGLRYLFPLMCLGYMLAYMFKASFLKRAILFASTLPIAIIMNSLRITLIGVTVDRWGQKMAEGLIHDFEGWIVFMGCALILLGEIQIMKRIGRKGGIDFETIRLPSLKSLPLPRSGAPNQAAAVFLGLALVLSIAPPLFFPHYVQPVPLQKSLTEFPMQIGDWTGYMGTLDEKSLAVLGTKDYLIADYTKAGEPPVNLYVLYYAKQDSTSNQAVHTPSGCIPAGGWTIESNTTKTIAYKDSLSKDTTLPLIVNRLLVVKGQTRQIVYYWFIQDGQNIEYGNLSRVAAIKSALLKGRTNGAMIRLITEITRNESEQTAEKRLIDFTEENVKDVMDYMFVVNKL